MYSYSYKVLPREAPFLADLLKKLNPEEDQSLLDLSRSFLPRLKTVGTKQFSSGYSRLEESLKIVAEVQQTVGEAQLGKTLAERLTAGTPWINQARCYFGNMAIGQATFMRTTRASQTRLRLLQIACENVAANAATVHMKIAAVARAKESCIGEAIAPLIASAPAQP